MEIQKLIGDKPLFNDLWNITTCEEYEDHCKPTAIGHDTMQKVCHSTCALKNYNDICNHLVTNHGDAICNSDAGLVCAVQCLKHSKNTVPKVDSVPVSVPVSTQSTEWQNW